MRSSQRIGLLILPVTAALALVGCGASNGKVSGTVTYGEKTVKGGTVTFVVPGKPPASAQIKEDGTYVAEAPAGSAKVCVETKSMNPASVKSVMKYGAPKDQKAPEGFGPAGPDKAELERRYVQIPDRYGDPDKTTLTTTVTGGAQTYNIKLEP